MGRASHIQSGSRPQNKMAKILSIFAIRHCAINAPPNFTAYLLSRFSSVFPIVFRSLQDGTEDEAPGSFASSIEQSLFKMRSTLGSRSTGKVPAFIPAEIFR